MLCTIFNGLKNRKISFFFFFNEDSQPEKQMHAYSVLPRMLYSYLILSFMSFGIILPT